MRTGPLLYGAYDTLVAGLVTAKGALIDRFPLEVAVMLSGGYQHPAARAALPSLALEALGEVRANVGGGQKVRFAELIAAARAEGASRPDDDVAPTLVDRFCDWTVDYHGAADPYEGALPAEVFSWPESWAGWVRLPRAFSTPDHVALKPVESRFFADRARLWEEWSGPVLDAVLAANIPANQETGEAVLALFDQEVKETLPSEPGEEIFGRSMFLLAGKQGAIRGGLSQVARVPTYADAAIRLQASLRGPALGAYAAWRRARKG